MTLTHRVLWIATTVLSGLLFLLSLFPVAFVCEDGQTVQGWIVLLWGWWGLLMANPAWFANPLFAVGFLLSALRQHLPATVIGVVAFGLGLFSFMADEWWFNEGSGTPITAFGPAFYLWMASFALLTLGNATLTITTRRPRPPAPSAG